MTIATVKNSLDKALRFYGAAALIGIFLGMTTNFPAFAYYDNYIPAPLFGNMQQLKQKLVSKDVIPGWSHTFVGGITANNVNGIISIEGKDKAGKPWTITDDNVHSLGGSCFTGDVDGNGVDDIIFHLESGACGYAWSILDIVFIDKNGTAHREEIVSRFNSNVGTKDCGVTDIFVPPSSHRHAQAKSSYVLIQDLTWGGSEDAPRSYWRWSLMQAKNCSLEEIHDACGINFPCYTAFMHKPYHKISAHTRVLEKHYAQNQQEQPATGEKKQD